MINITYKNKNQEGRKLIYTDNQLENIWEDIKDLLDNWAEILWVFN